ncbi:hypothetical protein ACIQTZ_04640 [Paenarthrobacter sp. NPDC090520]|uniref:hypothetical protein n=1 Tax=Paenarthrobacter sp. NPDC090520 TaxID=3364382 RepID=UPI0038159AC4
MATDNFARFIQESLVIEEDTDDGMDIDTLYGLYISWCRITDIAREPETRFLSTVRRHRLRWGRQDGGWVLVGLRMIGPAARDYVTSGAVLSHAGNDEVWELPLEPGAAA